MHRIGLNPIKLLIFALLCLGGGACGDIYAASPAGDVVGKISVGYQGWFACTGDTAPVGTWWHYGGSYQSVPTTNTLGTSVNAWPDMRQFQHGYAVAYPNFGNGQPATLFSSVDDQVVQTHFRWMAENGCDTAALQRFNPTGSDTVGSEGPTRNIMAQKVMAAAEANNVKFYIMYDCSGWNTNTFDSDIKNDWTNVLGATLHITNSPMYAMQNGKPVVCIWGFGFNDGNHNFSTNVCLDVINFFKSQGCYVIGGVPTWWRTGISDSYSNYLSVYSAFNMLSPWMVGRIGNTNDVNFYYANTQTGDQAYCNANGIDFQPCVLPGGNASQRAHGNFMWYQFAKMKQLGCQGIYISMFDEFGEGNQIACTAENAGMTPVGYTNVYYTLDQDGTACSADYYLRLTHDGGKMFKGQTAFTFTRPTQPELPAIIPPAPTNLTATAENAQVLLYWNGYEGATSYDVWRSLSPGGSYSLIATNVGLLSYPDTNVTPDTTYYYEVSAVDTAGQGPLSAPASVRAAVSWVINSGGPFMGSFAADEFYTAVNTSGTSAGIDTSGVTNPAPEAVYQTERWGPNIYSFPNLIPGDNYKVRLHFAEIAYNSAGHRKFNVLINGTQVLTNYDIFADAGAENKATIKEYIFPANVNGQIVIQYKNGTADNAKSSGIEILPVNPASLSAPQLAFHLGNNGLQFNWPADHLGWRLEAETNAPGAGIGANWGTVPGSTLTNQVSVPLNNVNGSVFYRLVYP